MKRHTYYHSMYIICSYYPNIHSICSTLDNTGSQLPTDHDDNYAPLGNK